MSEPWSTPQTDSTEQTDSTRPTASAERGGRRIVVAEDNALLREGLVHLLQRFGFVVVATATTGEGLIAAVQEHSPDVVLTDVRMPPDFRDEGLRAALQIRRQRPGLPVLVLSQYVEQAYATQLLADGEQGVGYLLKDRVGDVRALVAALEDVAAGGTVLDPQVVRQLLGRRRDPLAVLSERERETLALMAEGRSNVAIAERLVVTEATVAKHVRSILDKLDLPPSAADNRRVRAVITYLQEQG